MRKRRGVSYLKRVADVNKIYDECVRLGLSNREIWRRYVYPRFGISERTFYNLLKSSSRLSEDSVSSGFEEGFLFPDFHVPEVLDVGFFSRKKP